MKSVNDFHKMLKRFRKGVFSWPQLQQSVTDDGIIKKSSVSQITTLNFTEYKSDGLIWLFMDNSSLVKPLCKCL